MQSHIVNGLLQCHALKVLNYLLEDENGDKCTEVFVAAGGIGTILATMKAHGDEERIVGSVIFAHMHLAPKTAALADALALEGGLEFILKEAMPLFENNAFIQVLACTVLGLSLSYEDTVHVKNVTLFNPGCIGAVVRAMHTHPNHDGLQQMALNALTDMTFSVNLCHNLILSGGLLVMGNTMKQYSRKVELQYGAVGVIGNLAEAACIVKSLAKWRRLKCLSQSTTLVLFRFLLMSCVIFSRMIRLLLRPLRVSFSWQRTTTASRSRSCRPVVSM